MKTIGPSVITIKNLIQNFERTSSAYDDNVGNVGRILSSAEFCYSSAQYHSH